VYRPFQPYGEPADETANMTEREIEEYSALRATIRERGTTRVWVFVAGISAWAVLVTITAAGRLSPPVATLIPLLVLASVFEAVAALHLGVERIGRYLQVFFEDELADPGWEHRIMTFGRKDPSHAQLWSVDPLFSLHFWLASLLNLLPAALAGAVASEWLVIGACHALVAGRVATVRRKAARQREADLDLFRQQKQLAPDSPTGPARR
jgi:hypothetical protein